MQRSDWPQEYEAQVQEFIAWHTARVLRRTGKRPASSTLLLKATALRTAIRLTGSQGIEDFATHIQNRKLVECLLDQLAVTMSSGAAANAHGALLAFGEYALAQGWVEVVALERADRPPSNPQKPVQVFSPEELQALLSASRAKGLRWWALLHTVAGTGRRIGEALSLEWGWLNLTAEVPHFNLPHTKNGKQQYVPLTTFLREVVFTDENIATLQGEVRVGTNRRFGRSPQKHPFPWSYPGVNLMLARYCKTLGIEPRGFHCFRHTRATEMLSRGVPIQAVSALLGHSSVQTTDRIYNHATALSFAHYVD